MTTNFDQILANGGDAGALIRSIDWSKHPLGPTDAWPQSLKTALSICLESQTPILIWWGRELFQFYNDVYRPILGSSKHPAAMGAPGKEMWPEIWHIMGPIFEGVLAGGPSIRHEDMFMLLDRYGFREETYFNHAHSPIFGERGEIAGIFTTVTETTRRIIGDRRVRTLKALAEHAATTRDVIEACRRSVDLLGTDNADVPYCLLYLLDGDHAHLAGICGAGAEAAHTRVAWRDTGDNRWPLANVVVTGEAQLMDVASTNADEDVPRSAIALPVRLPGNDGKIDAVLVAGLSSHLAFDERYRDFLGLAAGQIASALASARAYEQQQLRLKALEDLDHAKTTFFTNVSHELRTPLTLILGPLEDALASPRRALENEGLATTHRNALRLLRLVNMLLDFARIEAGRVDARYEPTDLARITKDLASAFESAFERAGLSLEIDTPPLPAPVYVDHDMWEKIVLNLLSNALKFTFQGHVTVSLRAEDDRAVLTVRDTGTGIPEAELPRLFERFHRVQSTRARSHEGTGIGLALSRDLVRLHGGLLRVESVAGHGSAFMVEIPFGHEHLPADRIFPAQSPPRRHSSNPFVEEALRWQSEIRVHPVAVSSNGASEHPEGAPRILLAEDNADMREYVGRLLEKEYQLTSTANGEAALHTARKILPDLVLADVMMPGLDGFALLRELRADPRTRDIPVILLSARAGEESRLEGIEQGAEDYLIKPFSARELFARVGAHIALGRARSDAKASHEHMRALFLQAPVAVSVVRGPDFVFELTNPCYEQMVNRHDITGKRVREVFPEFPDDAPVFEMLHHVWTTGEAFTANDFRVLLDRRGTGVVEDGFFLFTCQPVRDPSGGIDSILSVAVDVTEQVRLRRQIETLSSEREVLLTKEQHARSEAESANRAKDEFLAMLGHELRNPLAPITTALHLMRQRDSAPDKERVIIERQVAHLTRLVDDLLDVSRITRGSVELKKEVLEISDVVVKAIEMASPLLEERQHHLTVNVPRGGLAVFGDPTRLAQVVANLLTNSAKYTDRGGHIEIDAESSDGDAVVQVRDDGIGIEPDVLPYVFDTFVQERQALDRSRGGLGLGLTIIRSLVSLHGGTVSARSRGRGQGSEFTVRLPLTAAEQRRKSRVTGPSSEPPRVPRGRRVLVVDDNVDAADLLAEWLDAKGEEVRVAYDGLSAIEMARKFCPEVALIDIGLPAMDGYEVARRLRHESTTEHARLVAVTGYGQKSDRERSANSGFDAHFVKPLDLEALDSFLAQVAR